MQDIPKKNKFSKQFQIAVNRPHFPEFGLPHPSSFSLDVSQINVNSLIAGQLLSGEKTSTQSLCRLTACLLHRS